METVKIENERAEFEFETFEKFRKRWEDVLNQIKKLWSKHYNQNPTVIYNYLTNYNEKENKFISDVRNQHQDFEDYIYPLLLVTYFTVNILDSRFVYTVLVKHLEDDEINIIFAIDDKEFDNVFNISHETIINVSELASILLKMGVSTSRKEIEKHLLGEFKKTEKIDFEELKVFIKSKNKRKEPYETYRNLFNLKYVNYDLTLKTIEQVEKLKNALIGTNNDNQSSNDPLYLKENEEKNTTYIQQIINQKQKIFDEIQGIENNYIKINTELDKIPNRVDNAQNSTELKEMQSNIREKIKEIIELNKKILDSDENETQKQLRKDELYKELNRVEDRFKFISGEFVEPYEVNTNSPEETGGKSRRRRAKSSKRTKRSKARKSGKKSSKRSTRKTRRSRRKH